MSRSSFYNNFTKYFGEKRIDKKLPFIKISKYSSHSVCNTCVKLNTLQKQAKSEEDWARVTAQKNQHRTLIGDARKSVEDRKQSALMFPSNNLFIQIGTNARNSLFLQNLLSLMNFFHSICLSV